VRPRRAGESSLPPEVIKASSGSLRTSKCFRLVLAAVRAPACTSSATANPLS
jgi:hypothetical protein